METSHPVGPAQSRIGQRTVKALVELRPPRFSADEAVAFNEHKARKVLYVRRFALVISPVFWLMFTYWDITFHVNYKNFGWILIVRVVGGLFMTTVAVLSFNKRFYREAFAEKVLLLVVTVAWLGVLAMGQLAPAPASYFDFVTPLPLILFFLFTVLWINPKPATLLGVILLAGYGVSMLMIAQTLPEGFVRPDRSFEEDFSYHAPIATFYLSFFVVLGSLVSHQLDGYLRREFIQQRALRSEKQRTEQLNHELQERILHIEKMNDQKRQQAEAVLQLKEEQRRLAVEANRKKSTFLAAATHDLRQPLTALQAIVEALNQSLDKGDVMAAKGHMDLTRRSSRAMRSTLNAVLEISRLESGIVDPDYSDFDLKKLVQDVYSQYATSAADKGLDFRLHLPSPRDLVLVRSDRGLLTRILSNLVSNAIKYTPARPDRSSGVVIGIVRFGARARARVDVYDTGVGIAKSDRTAIFEPFVQLGNRERDREKGLGLGLSIVRQIVDLLDQHRLEFRSVPGRGSRFSMEVPLAEIGAVELQAADLDDAPEPAGSIQGAYILLVEDDALVRSTVQAMLQSWGCLVEACADIEAVCAFVKRAERIPDVVLTDFRLPDDKSAYDVISAIHAEFQRDLPTVVMTGEVSALGEVRKAVSEVLPKPPDHSTLRQAIAACMPDKGR